MKNKPALLATLPLALSFPLQAAAQSFSGTGAAPADYGVAVATAAMSLDYVEGGVSVTAVPERSTYALMLFGLGVLGAVARRCHRA